MICLELFWVFFLIGAFTFGGGYAMVAMVQQQVVNRGWMEAAEVIDFVAIAESTPGPIAVNLATFVGAGMGGFWGAAVATLGVVVPSFVVILIVARCYQAFSKSRWIQGILSGLKPAVVGLIGSAVLSVAAAVLAPGGWSLALLGAPGTWLKLGATALLLLLSLKCRKLHPIGLICLCAVLGLAAGFLGF